MIKDIIILSIVLPPCIWLICKIFKLLQEIDIGVKNEAPPICLGRTGHPVDVALYDCNTCKWLERCNALSRRSK